MNNTLDYSDEINLVRVEKEDGSYEYYNEQFNLSYDKNGSSLTTQKVKFETLFVDDSKQITKKKQHKQTKTYKKKKTHSYKQNRKTMSMNTQFSSAVHSFTMNLFTEVLEKYGGKVVGSDDMNLEMMMKEFFGDFKPGKAVKVPKVKDDKPKKKKALSGYTHFGQQQKSNYDEHVKALLEKGEEKPKFVTWAAAEWKKLSGDEKEEWNQKAKILKEHKCKEEEDASDEQ
jgi:hypothetical protein